MGIRIALAGNPNSGKTSLFNAITGAMQKVGNWGGVTVEVKEGTATINGIRVTVIDLPGTYSLSAFSEEEQVARDYLVKEKPDVVINVIDATNLERHLYLTVQLMEMGIRPVLALNMWDEVTAKGDSVDLKQLQALLGVTAVTTSARNRTGIDQLMLKAVEQAANSNKEMNILSVRMPEELEQGITAVEESLKEHLPNLSQHRWYATKLFERDKTIEHFIGNQPCASLIRTQRNESDMQITKMLGDDAASLIAESRYGYIAGIARETIVKGKQHRIEVSDQIDTVLTHQFWAYPIFIIFMWLLFQATFKLGEYPMGWIESLVGWLQVFASSTLPAGVIREVIVDGIIAGVGGVIIFLPNIMILFFGISIMEDTGYMARAAFIMDRLMHRIGLHGKSFIPMIMGLGCSVPAIMAARTLESRNDRIKTILLTPLISCSARLPVFVLFAGTFFPKHAGNVVFLFQVVFSFGAFILMAILFKHTLFKGCADNPFVMELPPYRLPTVRSVLIHMWHKAEHYLQKMGGVVLLFSIILWWAGSYPESPAIEKEYDSKIASIKNVGQLSSEQREAEIAELETEKSAKLLEQSYIGRVGHIFEPLVRPFGTDWRGAVSLIAGFVAKEIVVGSMGVLYSAGTEETEESDALREKLKEHFTPLSAFAFMLFVLLYTPCIVAFITIIRELKNWKWSVFSVCYQLVFAFSTATLVFQIGKLLGLQ